MGGDHPRRVDYWFIPAVLPFLTILTCLQGQSRLLGACCQPCGVGAGLPELQTSLHPHQSSTEP